MARKKTREPDRLAIESSMAIAAGMSYGKWKGLQWEKMQRGKVLEQKIRQRTCTRKEWHEYRRNHRKAVQEPVVTSKPQPTGTRQVCKNCGKEFIYKRKGREKVFCDEDCKKLYYKRNLVYVPLIKKCEWCGKSFEASKSNQMFCCKNCGSVASYYRRRELLKSNG